jgi:hypothetical protein
MSDFRLVLFLDYPLPKNRPYAHIGTGEALNISQFSFVVLFRTQMLQKLHFVFLIYRFVCLFIYLFTYFTTLLN